MMTIVWKLMMIIIIMTNRKTTTRIIITQKMKKMMIITSMNLKMMIKIQMMIINLENLLVQKEEEADKVCIIPYPEEMAS